MPFFNGMTIGAKFFVYFALKTFWIASMLRQGYAGQVAGARNDEGYIVLRVLSGLVVKNGYPA
jgi:hypothetical protein